MIIASQNISRYDISLPDDVIYRINLAWIDSLEMLRNILNDNTNNAIFLDLPKNRTKPPNNRYSLDEIKPIIKNFSNIKYLAISNIDTSEDLKPFLDLMDKIIVVPKIESPLGVKNIESITNLLGAEKIIMLDHDDLYSSMLKSNKNPENFQVYLKSLIDFCDTNKITLLRTVGVLFADTEKRISDYVK